MLGAAVSTQSGPESPVQCNSRLHISRSRVHDLENQLFQDFAIGHGPSFYSFRLKICLVQTAYNGLRVPRVEYAGGLLQ